MNEPAQNSDSPMPRDGEGRPRRLRYFLLIPALLLLIAAAAVAAAPTLLSTGWGRDAALSWFNRSIPGEVTMEDVSLSWLGGQSVRALAVNDALGQPVLTLDAFTTELGLLGALSGRLSLGQTVIQGLSTDLKFGPDGASNLAAAWGATPGEAGADGRGIVVPATGNMALIDSRVSIAAPGIKPIVLDNLSGALEMTGAGAPIKLSFGGRSRQGELAGSFTVNGQVNGLLSDGRLTPASAQVDVQGSIEDLPVDALDQLLNLRGALNAALGDRTSLHVEASGDAARQNISIDARAPNGELKLEGYVDDGRFGLSRPASARLQLTPALIEAVNRLASGDPALRLSAAVPLHLTIEQLGFPVDRFSLSTLALRAGLDARGPIQLTGVKEVGEAAVNDLRMIVDSPGLGSRVRIRLNGKPVTHGKTGSLALNADVEHLFDDSGELQTGGATVRVESRITGVPTTLIDAALQQNGLLLEAAGPTVGMNLDADTDESGRIAVSLDIDSAHLNTGPVQLSIADDITLTQPARIRFDLTPDLWRRFAGEATTLQPTGTSNWTLELRTFRMPVPAGEAPAFQPERTALHAALTTPGLAFRGTPDTPPTGIENVVLDVAGDTLDAFAVNASGALVQAGGLLASFDASPLRVTLDARTGLKPDASLKAITNTVGLDSAGLKAVLKTIIDEGFVRLTLTEPAAIDATITPALLASAQDGTGPRASLREASQAQATLDRLIVPLAPFDYAGFVAEGKLRLDALVIESTDGVSSTIDEARASFNFDGGNRGRFELDLNGRVRAGDGETGKLSVAMTLGNLLDARGGISGDALSLELDGRLQHLPSALLDQLLDMDGMLAATLGAATDVTVDTRLDNMRGPLSLTLDASNTRADIKARVGDAGLTLTEPLVAQLEPTPEFGQKVLAKVHPIFESTQRAEQPIRLEMPADGVLIPIDGHDFSKVTVPAMTLDFGRIVLKSGWLLRGIIGLGQQFGKLESVQREEWLAWFTPSVLEIKNGEILYTRRMDLLLDQKLHLATWGSADVAGDRSNLILAFMPDTMERVFSITTAEHDALHVPITGPLSGPRIDFKKAVADLARLRAQEEVAGDNPLAGALLGRLGERVTDGGPVPPASVSPLPWAELLEAQDAARGAEQESDPQQDQADQPAPERKPSTEEQVIKELIDIFGKKKKEE